MTADSSSQGFLIQLETALHRLVEGFWEEPNRYLTESDAATAPQSWFASRPELAQVYRTADRFQTSLLHHEYPTFFRLNHEHPVKRGEQPYGQAHYDLVVLNPDFLRSHDAETVTNQRSKDQVEHPQPPLVADVEVRLFIQSWKPEEDALVGQDLANLRLALEIPPDASAPYMCVFCRDASSQPEDPENYRLAVERLLAQYPHTEFVVAACWPQHESESFVHYSGPWITTVTA